MTQIIAIVSQKGGVGKTSLTHNLGYELSQAGKHVLLVDFDPQADLTSSLGLSASEERPTVYQAMAKPEDVSKYIVNIKGSLDLLPSDLDLAGAEIKFTLDMLGDRNMRLKEALEPVADDYDFILIDAPPSLGFFTVNALICASKVIIPLQCEHLAKKALYNLLEIVLQLQKRNKLLRIGGIVLTFYDRRVKITEEIEDEVRGEFGQVVFNTTVPRNTSIMHASKNGLAVAQYLPKSAGAIAYHGLVKEVIERG